MANIFLNLPMPVGDGAGASVDTSAMGGDKTIVVGGSFERASVTIEASTDGVEFQPIWAFTAPGKKVLPIASMFMRVFVTGRSAEPFSATTNIGANDAGALFFGLPLPAGDGAGAPVDVSTLGNFTTFVVGGEFQGAGVAVQISEDGVDYATCENFAGVAGIASKVLVANFMRTFVSGRVGNSYPFTPVVAVGATVDAGGGGGGGGGITIPHIIQTGDGTASAGADAAVVIADGDLLGGIAADVSATGSGAFAMGVVASAPGYTTTILAAGAGAFAGGSSTNGADIKAQSPGSFAQGFVDGVGSILTRATFAGGSFAQGYASGGAYIYARAEGCFSQGRARKVGGFTGSSYIKTDSGGSFAQGATYNGAIRAFDEGCFAQGYARGGNGYAGYIEAGGRGSFAQGQAQYGYIRASFLGSFAQGDAGYGSYIVCSGSGGFAQGHSGTYAKIRCNREGGFAQGFVDRGDIYCRADGGHASGWVDGTSATLARIWADLGAVGAFARGSVEQRNAAFSAHINAEEPGSVAMGRVYSNLGGANAALTAGSTGSFAQGYAKNSVIKTGLFAEGAFAQGYAQDGGTIWADGRGSFAQGQADGSGGSPLIKATTAGAFASGYAFYNGRIEAGNSGDTAMGYAAGSGVIYANGAGSFALGSVYGGTLQATGTGSLAGGQSRYGTLSSTYAGSFAFGSIDGGYRTLLAGNEGAWAGGFADAGNINSSGIGSLAFGHAAGANASAALISATANNAVQFGPGTNAQADSLKVGNAGLSLKGKTGAPTTPVDGNIWMVGTATYLRQEGANGKIQIGAAPSRVVGISMCDGLIGYGNMAQYANFAGSLGNWFSLDSGGSNFVNFSVPVEPGDIISAVKIWGTSGGSAGDELQAKLFTGVGNSSAQLSTTKTSGLVSGLDDIEWTGADASLPYTVLSATRVVISVRLPNTTFQGDVSIFGIDVTIS